MSTTLVLLLLAGAGLAIYYLVNRVTDMGGTSDRPAEEIADQVWAETDAYRGSRSPDDPPWDGQKRIAPPISDGGGGSPVS